MNEELKILHKEYQRELKKYDASKISSIIQQALLLSLPGILPNSEVLEAKIRKETVEMLRQGSTIEEIEKYIITNSKKIKV